MSKAKPLRNLFDLKTAPERTCVELCHGVSSPQVDAACALLLRACIKRLSPASALEVLHVSQNHDLCNGIVPQQAYGWSRRACTRRARRDASQQIPTTHCQNQFKQKDFSQLAVLSIQGHLHGQNLQQGVCPNCKASHVHEHTGASTSAPQRGSRLLQAARMQGACVSVP